MPRRVGVVSSAQTEWRNAWSGAQHIDLISAAVQQALEGSGLRIEDVDFIIDSGSDVLDGRSISNLHDMQFDPVKNNTGGIA